MTAVVLEVSGPIPPAADALTVPSEAISGLRIPVAITATVVFAIACQWSIVQVHVNYVALNTITSALLVGAGLHLWRDPARRRLGLATAICGPLWSAQFLTGWNAGPAPVVGGFSSQMFFSVGGLGVLGYPTDLRTNRWDRAAILELVAIYPFTQLLVSISAPATFFGFGSATWWWAAPWLTSNTELVQNLSVGASLLLEPILAVAVALRLKQMMPMDRLVLLPVGTAALVTGAVSISAGVGAFFVRFTPFFAIEALLVSSVPLSLVTILMWQDRTHVRVAETLSQTFATSPSSLSSVRASLQRSLNDASLEIFYWSESSGSYVDEEGQRIQLESTDLDGFYIHEIRNANDSALALLKGHKFLGRHERIVTTAINASTVALENARLQASILAQLDEVTRSRDRVAQAALVERQRIERDLHDGVQQRLLALSMRLSSVTKSITDESVRSILDQLGIDLRSTNSDLRNFVRAIHPPELRQFGLMAAVGEIAADLPHTTTIDVTNKRFSPAVEATAYFIVSESIANVVKHAGATTLAVTIAESCGHLLISIEDNGVGIVDATGRGLVGLRDRAISLGGTLEIGPLAVRGTVVKARIPC